MNGELLNSDNLPDNVVEIPSDLVEEGDLVNCIFEIGRAHV